MAKILISSLGTGKLKENNTSMRKYAKTAYRFSDSGKEYETSFVAAALSEYLEVDKVYLVGTSKSMWEEVYDHFASESKQNLDHNYWIELGEKVGSFKLGQPNINEKDLIPVNKVIDGYLKSLRASATGGSRCFIIDYGLNEKELWTNFDVFMRIGDTVEENNEIYLDITHAFRSIPLFMYLMLDLIKILKSEKNFKISGLFYGMLEARSDLGYAPIVDLSSLYNITLWARGAYNFINFGNGYLLSELIKNEKISQKIRNISNLVNINYLTDLQAQIKSLNKFIDIKSEEKGPTPYIFPLIKDFIFRFSKIETASEFQLELSKWYFENKRYGHGYICLVEAILTKLCEVYGLDLTNFNNRECVKKLVVKRYYQNKVKELEKLADKYNSINKVRNRIAHAAFYQDENYSFTANIDQAAKNYEDIKKLLESKNINKLNNIIPIQELSNSNN